ncbi:predicted protein [Histoplasma mississippiense (nom. inval.)]|uniref:predicted protein n=1 Tax=Ajellomyces capsulatus (strain NAm1 / WU24) TaxID=2059318 RepID=UPI000157C5BB|nr:predicted protein [Histoplasma mississippiense (nom. inval.)]EDN08569.1 predicted protein [Histoplasma mississippiense (nom. inval.)]
MRSTEITRLGDDPIAQPDMAFGATLRHSFLSSSSRTWITSPQLSNSGEKFSPEAFLGGCSISHATGIVLWLPPHQDCHISDASRTVKQRGLVVYTPHIRSESEMPYYHPSVRALALSYDLNCSAKSETEDSGTLSIHFSPFTPELPQSIAYRLQRTLLALLSTHLRLSRKPFAAAGPPRSKTAAPKDNIVLQHVVQNTYSRLKETYAAPIMNSWVETTEPSKHVFEDIAIAAFLIELWRGMYSSPLPKAKSHANEAENSLPAFPGFVDIACGNGVLTYILHAEGYGGWGFDARQRKSWSTFPASTQDRLKQIICIPKPFKDALEQHMGEDSNLTSTQKSPSDIHDGIFDKNTFVISNHADELTVWTPLLGALSNPENPLPFLAIPCCSHAMSGMRHRYPAPKSQPKTKDPNKTSRATDLPSNTNNIKNNNSVHVINGSTNATRQQQQKPEMEEISPTAAAEAEEQQNPQPSTGNLKELRALRLEETTNPDCQSSAYASLTAKVMLVARDAGYGSDVEKTLLRIPSTRNVGIVGGVKRMNQMNQMSRIMGVTKGGETGVVEGEGKGEKVGSGVDLGFALGLVKNVSDVVERECRRDGGLRVAAKLWVERSLRLQEPQGRGRLKGRDGHVH